MNQRHHSAKPIGSDGLRFARNFLCRNHRHASRSYRLGASTMTKSLAGRLLRMSLVNEEGPTMSGDKKMRSLLLIAVAVLGFNFPAKAQNAQAWVDSAAGAAQAASAHASTASYYQGFANSYANVPFVGSWYASTAREYATYAVIAAQTSLSLASAASTSSYTQAQAVSLTNSVNTAIYANTVGTSILSGSGACSANGEGCPVQQ